MYIQYFFRQQIVHFLNYILPVEDNSKALPAIYVCSIHELRVGEWLLNTLTEPRRHRKCQMFLKYFALYAVCTHLNM